MNNQYIKTISRYGVNVTVCTLLRNRRACAPFIPSGKQVNQQQLTCKTRSKVTAHFHFYYITVINLSMSSSIDRFGWKNEVNWPEVQGPKQEIKYLAFVISYNSVHNNVRSFLYKYKVCASWRSLEWC